MIYIFGIIFLSTIQIIVNFEEYITTIIGLSKGNDAITDGRNNPNKLILKSEMKHNHDHNINLKGLMDFHGLHEAKQIRRVILIGCGVNLCLMIMKLLFGYFGHSEALVADGFHSVGDVGTDLVMLAFVGLSFREPTRHYSYGYGKFETFASMLVSGILLSVAVLIAIEGIESIQAYLRGEVLPKPDGWTLVAICVAILGKEFLFRFYKITGKRTRCNALVSAGWHHRSDALSSLCALIGVSFAHFLGEEWRVLDPCASLVIVIFILIPACRLFFPAFRELMEGSLPHHDYDEAYETVEGVEGVKGIKMLHTRKSGPFMIFDAEIYVDGNLNINQGYMIASTIEHELIHKFGKNIRVSVVTIPKNS